ncbi:hypothetical protein BMETH_1750_0 [methanotrophic bacterial endosymbiont of Bathymodiolus sp.]|nr:hypothetical protein BMETH_1750_0 [methanotrophic bacterial endosymbiont of Bathymodiolus sp.]
MCRPTSYVCDEAGKSFVERSRKYRLLRISHLLEDYMPGLTALCATKKGK